MQGIFRHNVYFSNVPFSTMITVQDDTITDDDGVHIGYIDSSDGDVKWYSRADKNVECNFEIEAALSNVKALNEELTVTSYDIYKNGTIDDLLDFINDKMSIISICRRFRKTGSV